MVIDRSCPTHQPNQTESTTSTAAPGTLIRMIPPLRNRHFMNIPGESLGTGCTSLLSRLPGATQSLSSMRIEIRQDPALRPPEVQPPSNDVAAEDWIYNNWNGSSTYPGPIVQAYPGKALHRLRYQQFASDEEPPWGTDEGNRCGFL